MKNWNLQLAGLLLIAMAFGWPKFVSAVQDEYALTADSLVQENVPKGEVRGPFTFHSEIYPGTQRNYWVYVPAGYKQDSKPCLLVVQDGLGRANDWKLPTVMDNLIHKKEMPITLGLFVDHGVVPADSDEAQPRFNRSFEYDSMGDRYARFLIDELLPEVAKEYSFSDDPNDRAIAGASSGGICAFNVAWERPDQFRRVICTIGTFVGLRGGDEFSTLVRKTEAKPIRVFLQDGSNDLDIYAGGWWTANQGMLAALQWAGYDVHHQWGDGGHNGKHGAAVMPDAMRWLWRDYPDAIEVDPENAKGRRLKVLTSGEGWVEDPSLASIEYITADSNGQVIAETKANSNQLKLNSGVELSWKTEGIIQVKSEIGTTQVELRGVNGLALSPDHCWVWASQKDSSFLTHYRLTGASKKHNQKQSQQTARLEHAQVYGDLHVPHRKAGSSAGAMLTDTVGNVFVATEMGIQVLDPLGRVNLIVNNPTEEAITDMCWGGEERNELYVATGGKVFRRKLQVQGTVSWLQPVKPPKPGL